MPYRIEYRKSFKKMTKGIPHKCVVKIQKAIEGLAENPAPHGYEMIKGLPKGMEQQYRIKVWPCRIIYEVHDDYILVLIREIVTRENAYKKK